MALVVNTLSSWGQYSVILRPNNLSSCGPVLAEGSPAMFGTEMLLRGTLARGRRFAFSNTGQKPYFAEEPGQCIGTRSIPGDPSANTRPQDDKITNRTLLLPNYIFFADNSFCTLLRTNA